MAVSQFRIYAHWLVRGTALQVPQPDGSTVNARGCIGFEGEGGYRLVAYFIEEGVALPSGTYDEAAMAGTMYLPLAEWADYLDFVRSAPILCAYLDSARPEANAIQTLDQVGADVVTRT